MQYAGIDFLCLSYVPEIFTEISARPPRNVHLVVVGISAVRALPLQITVDNNLPIITALVAKI